MRIAGLIKASLIDYPGKASAVVFFGGCNFRCGYCHNPEVVNGGIGQIELEDFFAFLKKRKRFLDAVCISGGEPTLQEGLVSFAKQVKELGYEIKLDTNGSHPEVLQELFAKKLVDYVAMDVKAPLARYREVAGAGADGNTVEESRRLVVASGIPHEFRTTVCKEQLALEDLLVMADELIGSEKWFLQQFHKQDEILDERGSYSAYTMEEMEGLAHQIREYSKGKESICVNVR